MKSTSVDYEGPMFAIAEVLYESGVKTTPLSSPQLIPTQDAKRIMGLREKISFYCKELSDWSRYCVSLGLANLVVVDHSDQTKCHS
jgi:hypothetical protein